jgi:hypothetical protein
MKYRCNDIDMEEPKYLEKKHVQVPLWPPQIPYRMAWNTARAIAVRGRQLTTMNISFLTCFNLLAALNKKKLFIFVLVWKFAYELHPYLMLPVLFHVGITT